jgi:putative spermidine/putrescine transport system substrate-binding protein/mannopine transport system substrate-binding protein
MTEKVINDHVMRGLSRRTLIQSAAAAMGAPLIAGSTLVWAQDKLAGSGEVVVYSYGGSFTQGVRKYVYEPFTKATGIKVIDVVADLAEPQVNAMVRAGRIDWDIAAIQAQSFPAMQQAGIFVPIDYGLWDPESVAGSPQETRLKDAVVVGSSAQVIAYDIRAYPQGGPKNWVDFWDVKKFPGPRGLYAVDAKRNIQFALLASGVAPKDIWPFTEEKIDRAFKKLDEIKPHVAKWWTAGGEAPQLLMNREYAMTSAFDNRMIIAMGQGAPVRFIWDGAYKTYTWVSILKGGPNTTNAQKLLAFLYRAQIAAGWTQGTLFPGANVNQLKHLSPELAAQVNVNPQNHVKAIMEDSAWLAAKRPDGKTNVEHLQQRWLQWRAA